MAKKGTAKGAAARHDLAQRLAECAAQVFIVELMSPTGGWESHHLECEIRDRLAANSLVALFEEILSREVSAVVIPKGAEPPPDLGPGTIVSLAPGLAPDWDVVTPVDTAGEIVAALGEAATKGWDAPLCTLTADPQLAIVKMQMGNGASSVKRNGIHTPVPLQDVAAYVRRVVEAIG